MTASVTRGPALRYARGSARRILYHQGTLPGCAAEKATGRKLRRQSRRGNDGQWASSGFFPKARHGRGMMAPRHRQPVPAGTLRPPRGKRGAADREFLVSWMIRRPFLQPGSAAGRQGLDRRFDRPAPARMAGLAFGRVHPRLKASCQVPLAGEYLGFGQ